jgi:pilus assembly protein CpaC
MRSAFVFYLGGAAALLLAQNPPMPRDLVIAPGKSVVLDSPVDVQRVSVADPEVAEAVGISPREVVINGKKVGETSVIIWQQGGGRLLFDAVVRPKTTRLDRVRGELAREMKGQDVQISLEGESVFLRGTVDTLTDAGRAEAIARTLGKPVNLLKVKIPEGEPQILLKVRFANVDRSAGNSFGINLLSTGATNTIGSVSSQQFSPPSVSSVTTAGGRKADSSFTLSDALNIFIFRPDLNLGATIKALQSRQAVEILAEPNLLTSNGKAASFLAGGEFPYPVVQSGGGGLATVTIQFREFGVRLNFTPTITARGSIRLEVAPEVSSLDYANGLVYQGFSIPGLAMRKVKTEVELEDRQSFAIAGLLDNRVTDILNKIPGLSNIPLLGKLFQSRSENKNKQELLVLVTPEIVYPISRDGVQPEINMPKSFLKDAQSMPTRTPSSEVTGSAQPRPVRTVPIEQLEGERRSGANAATVSAGTAAVQTAPGGSAPAPSTPAPAVKP